MKKRTQALELSCPGTRREITSYHFTANSPGSRRVYLQGSLHADEWPGTLVITALKEELERLESEGKLLADFTLVPFCNPIGLDQNLLYASIGRFDLNSGKNFNRDFPCWNEKLAQAVQEKLTDDPGKNLAIVRAELKRLMEDWKPKDELECLKKALFSLSLDHDFVLDLHCDFEAVVHLYTQPEFWPSILPFACALGSQAQLLADQSGDNPFDEAIAGHWVHLRGKFGAEKIPLGCQAATIEFRGQSDIQWETAQKDAKNLCVAFAHLGLIDEKATRLPPLAYEPTPLAGSENIIAPTAGLVSFRKNAGDPVQAGEVVFDLIDPLEGKKKEVRALHSGVLYARHWKRYSLPGMSMAKIATKEAFKTGPLLSAR